MINVGVITYAAFVDFDVTATHTVISKFNTGFLGVVIIVVIDHFYITVGANLGRLVAVTAYIAKFFVGVVPIVLAFSAVFLGLGVVVVVYILDSIVVIVIAGFENFGNECCDIFCCGSAVNSNDVVYTCCAEYAA